MHDHETENGNHPTIDVNIVVTPAPVAVAVPGESDCVLHNLETAATYRLNDVGARIWELIENSHTVAEIQAQLCADYRMPDDVSAQQVAQDVANVITELHQYGLLTFESRSSAV
jgi:Coenzyme PQQ synthesis protein D (PqqD)